MSHEAIQEMNRILELQKSLNIKEGAPDIALRKDRLDRVIAMVNKYDKQIIKSVTSLKSRLKSKKTNSMINVKRNNNIVS